MVDDHGFFSPNGQKLAAIFVFTWAGSSFKMLGDTLREIAALIFIFVPLELWQDHGFEHIKLMEFTAGGTAVFFIVGAFAEYASALAFRLKKDLEGSRETN